jgi:hypothetical protein
MFFNIRNRVLSLQPLVSSKTFTPGAFTGLIRRQFSSKAYVFRTAKNYAVDINSIIVGGLYDNDNAQENLPYIEITLYYHPEQPTFTGNDLNWDQISFDIAECITHEHIHQQQIVNKIKLKRYVSKADDYELRVEQNYLGHDEEIDAYGFSIAAESVVFGKPYNMCSMYHVYKTTFDTDHSVVVKLEQEIVKYLEQLTLEPNHEQDYSGNRQFDSGRYV